MKALLRIAALGAALVASGVAWAQDAYPNKVVRIIAPTSAGGANDVVARLIADGLGKRWGHRVVVENRPGAGTIIGTEAVARAPADGYTLLMGLSTLAINPATYKQLPYDALRDFAPITQAVSLPGLIVVHPSVPAASLKELIALAKAKPGSLNYASAGTGTHPHLSMELLTSMADIKLVHVPYKSVVPAMTDLIGGHVAASAMNMLDAIPHVRAGKVKALAVTSAKRLGSAPEIPTVAESGVAGYESVQWYGLLAPAGTPADLVDKIYRDAAAVLRAPENVARLANDGVEVAATTPAQFAALIRGEMEKWGKVARAAGVKPE